MNIFDDCDRDRKIKDVYEDNIVSMPLGEFLKMRDALKFMEEIRAFALDSKAEYGTDNRRDVHEIGYHVLAKLNIPVKRSDEEDLFS